MVTQLLVQTELNSNSVPFPIGLRRPVEGLTQVFTHSSLTCFSKFYGSATVNCLDPACGYLE